MKRRLLPIPQPDKFNPGIFILAAQQTLDGERIARELAEADGGGL